MPCVNVTKKRDWMGSNYVQFMDNLFCQASRRFLGVRAVSREEGRVSWGLDTFIPDEVKPFSHGFILLVPYGVVNMCLPEAGCELW